MSSPGNVESTILTVQILSFRIDRMHTCLARPGLARPGLAWPGLHVHTPAHNRACISHTDRLLVCMCVCADNNDDNIGHNDETKKRRNDSAAVDFKTSCLKLSSRPWGFELLHAHDS